jgi:membrane-associated phospholipid phosphatase
MYYAALVYPAVVDVVAVTWIGHGAADTAGQMALIDTEAFAITGLLSFVSNATIRRARPYLRECAAGKPDPRFPPCQPAGQSESFFSGHTGIAFTGAMLTCMHHVRLPLYDKSRIGGTIVCGSMMGGAAATGVARIMGDKHYASDVLVGAAIGLASGFLVPWLHYRGGPQRQETGSIRLLPAPFAAPSGGGMGVVGLF